MDNNIINNFHIFKKEISVKSNTITLNTYLFFKNMEIIDYVIVHELCHMKFFNHSSSFWGLVKTIIPNYKIIRQQLKGI
jgi:predicted metal-dependent hydrolase